jgi:SAM-dependent methyltransferase
MEPREYEKMADVEDRMWWYHGLHRHLLACVRRFLRGPDARVLDAGCGTGGLLRALGAGGIAGHLVGLDAWHPACRLAAERSGQPIVRGVLQRLPFDAGSLDCVVSADVLCHANVDPAAALREMRRCLRPDGVVVLNLPAYQWMLAEHDRRVQNARRFTRTGVRRLLGAAGFEPLYTTYWNTLLFPAMALRRLLPGSAPSGSDVHPYPPAVEWSCRVLLGLEYAWLAAGLALPFGGSVLAVARRHDG